MTETSDNPEVLALTPAEVHRTWLDRTRAVVDRTWAFGASTLWTLNAGVQTGINAEHFPAFIQAGTKIAERAASSGIDISTLKDVGNAIVNNPGPAAAILSATAAVGFFGAGVMANIRHEFRE